MNGSESTCLFACFFKASGGVFPAQNDPGGNRAGKKKNNPVIICV